MTQTDGKFRGKRPRVGASFGGAQWGPEPPSVDAPRTPRPTYGKTAAQLDSEIAEALAQRKKKQSHATVAAPVHHDRLATAIARVVRDPHYWRRGSFDIDDAMQALPKLQGAYDWQRVLDLADDYLQGVVGVAGATGGGFPERATRGVGGHEVKAAQSMIQRLRRVAARPRAHSTKKQGRAIRADKLGHPDRIMLDGERLTVVSQRPIRLRDGTVKFAVNTEYSTVAHQVVLPADEMVEVGWA